MAQNKKKTVSAAVRARLAGPHKRGTGKPFSPGVSGNPGGRPKTAKFAEAVREFLDEQNGKSTRLRQVLLDLQMHDPKILLYYGFGKPVEQLDVHSTSTVAQLPDDYLAILRAHAQSR